MQPSVEQRPASKRPPPCGNVAGTWLAQQGRRGLRCSSVPGVSGNRHAARGRVRPDSKHRATACFGPPVPPKAEVNLGDAIGCSAFRDANYSCSGGTRIHATGAAGRLSATLLRDLAAQAQMQEGYRATETRAPSAEPTMGVSGTKPLVRRSLVGGHANFWHPQCRVGGSSSPPHGEGEDASSVASSSTSPRSWSSGLRRTYLPPQPPPGPPPARRQPQRFLHRSQQKRPPSPLKPEDTTPERESHKAETKPSDATQGQHSESKPFANETYDAVASGGHLAARCKQTETEIAIALQAAKSQGTDELRRVVKQLLLRWHPDKVSKSQPDTAAALEEANRVFRFVVDARAKLGI